MNKVALVTGGAGFIGSNFVRYLLEHDPTIQVITLDALTYAGSLENLNDLPDPDRHVFIEGNITDQALVEGLIRAHHVNVIVHFAAETHVDRSIFGPAEFIETNIIGTFRLLEAARKIVLEEHVIAKEYFHFHHISTDEVFGALGPGDSPFVEDTPYAPNSPYAASKASSDHLVRAYFHTYGLPVTITNCSNNYGPFQFLEKLIPLVITNALAEKPLPIYGDGQQIRDWLYVEDHCEAIWLAIVQGQKGETYNIGGNTQLPNLQVVETVCGILDQLSPRVNGNSYQGLIEFVPDRPGHDWRYDMDSGKIAKELGWRPKESFRSGMVKTVEWYLAHPEWVSAIQGRGDFKEWMGQNYLKRKGEGG